MTEPTPEPRREFQLPAEDEEALDRAGERWEAIKQGNAQWVLVHGVDVPPGYTVKRASVALNIPTGYPDSQVDMAYFHPDLTPVDGRPIKALSKQSIDGKQWQRWSRHRTSANPWVPGVDDVGTHLIQVRHWVAREVADLGENAA